MDVFYPVYLFDLKECETAMGGKPGRFFEAVIGDEDNAGLAVAAAGDFPYNYDYTCEWDATLIYLAVRPKLTSDQLTVADSVFGPLFMYKQLTDPNNYRFFAKPPIPKNAMVPDRTAFHKKWYQGDVVRLFSTEQVAKLLDEWDKVDWAQISRLALEFFPQFDDGDIFQNENDFASFVQAWIDALNEARERSLCLVQVAVED